MAEPLVLTDLLLALVLAITGGLLGRRAGRRQPRSAPPQARRRPVVLYVAAAVAAARLAAAFLLLATSGGQLVAHRFLLGLPGRGAAFGLGADTAQCRRRAHQHNVFTHLWPGKEDLIGAFGTAGIAELRAVPAGRPVVLRLINRSKEPHRILLGGTPFRVTAHDGNPIGEPGELKPGTDLFLAAGAATT
ncbi:hypothetical protein QMZ92_33720 [Streptomyces sp. HNM0645]|uniref:hypothetical protein n=1 Tax=Streptomyces sp. HNM0645 TaxID=2782343 RepID=UPI0024B7F5DF|nr:hypothetical protein [Streptomyces sp. HNM0645]MDI9889164.1 hypothetical protein [Streptomyces sp. HNM0645]